MKHENDETVCTPDDSVADYAVWIAEEAHMAELESKKAAKEFKKLTQK